MIQGGCPHGTGTGGPGYEFEDEINDTRSSAARSRWPIRGRTRTGASSSSSPPTPRPGSTASTRSSAAWPPGMEAVDAIEGLETGAGDRPVEDARIERMEVQSSEERRPAVELLWWDGCPSHPDALADLERILAEEGLGSEVELVEIDTDEQAERALPGSPTILDGGRGHRAGREGEPFTLTCRVYRLRDGRISPRQTRTPAPRGAPRRTNEHSIGDSAPGFSCRTPTAPSTPADDGITAVVFTCNHCPYALAWHDRLGRRARLPGRALPRDQPQRRRALPGDSFEAMQRARRGGGLDDALPPRRVAGGGERLRRPTTPDVFVIDGEGRLRYRGAPDADHNDPSLNAAWLREALDALLAGEEPARAETPPKAARSSGSPDQPQIARTAAAMSLRSSSTASGSEARSSSSPRSRWPPRRARPPRARRARRAACPRRARRRSARRTFGRPARGRSRRARSAPRAGRRRRPPRCRASARGRRRSPSTRRWRRRCR